MKKGEIHSVFEIGGLEKKMTRDFYLLSLKLSGIKNIEKEIEFNFYKKTVDASFNPLGYNVKAIYGENGSGKTGIIMAINILKNIILNWHYLSDSTNQTYLKNVINKKTKRLYLECEFLNNIGQNRLVYKYIISIEDKDGLYQITKEQLLVRSSAYATSHYKGLYEVNNNELMCYVDDEFTRHLLNKVTANLLYMQSFVSVISHNIALFDSKEIKQHAVSVTLLGLFLITSLDQSDIKDNLQIRESLKAVLSDKNRGITDHNLYPTLDLIKGNKRYIYKDDFDEYKAFVSKLTIFIRIFKPELKNILIEKTEDANFYYCSLVMDYGEYKVSQEYESAGINKLVQLYDCLAFAMSGSIVFIDEMDSNINDVYLCKLIEFYVLYGEGQLCFTTHNTSPMSVLRHNKNAIDFLSSNNNVIPWRKNGNFRPENLYRNGMIKCLPFNIEAEDFIGVIGD